jgi:hypothetical protein
VRRLDLGRTQGAPHAVIGHQIIHPGQAFEVMAVELAGHRSAQRRQHTRSIPAEDWAVRHVGEAGHSQRPLAHML